MNTSKFVLLAAALAASPLSPLRAQNSWVNLFNGTNLDGWAEHSGQAKYTVADGVLTGESVSGSGNSFLCTTQTFGNFELELEYKCDALLNYGVQIRSEVFPDARTLKIDGKEYKLPPDRIHGYQCEIDMDTARGRMWSGGIYDEARRGWLWPADGEKGPQGLEFSEQGRKISKPGEWNKLRIVADGPSIKTWLNGVPRADITDRLTPSGVIGLQVHGVGDDTNKVGLKVSFRNVRLREIQPENNTLTAQEKADGWLLLWDGKTMDGWRSPKSDALPAKSWVIRDGELSVVASGNAEAQAGGDIITRRRYANFELTADFRATPGCNSGIKIFVQPDISPVDPKTGVKTAVGSAIGLEFQILDDERHPDAKLGRDGDRTLGSLYDLIPAPKDKKVLPIGEWNHVRIVAQGRHVEFWLNGEKTVAFERGSPDFRQRVAESKFKNIPGFGEWADGHILLQEHGSAVSFRNVKLRELPAK
ncbi:MAG TPA: DUF1080 domain-containing protein [Candidatus Acidoferrum sp.]|nr:DUF1080 domain-containing protein [Candidatus Acidoferrum sp.]